MLDSDTNMGARTMQSMVPLGTRAPTNQITPIVPGEADDLTRARGRGRLWRLNGRAVDVLWIEMASARFEAVSRRIQKKLINSASRILRESKILCGFFRGRRRNERERDRRPYIYMMEASSPFACCLVSCQFGKKFPKKSGDRRRRRTHYIQMGGGRARERIVSSVA